MSGRVEILEALDRHLFGPIFYEGLCGLEARRRVFRTAREDLSMRGVLARFRCLREHQADRYPLFFGDRLARAVEGATMLLFVA